MISAETFFAKSRVGTFQHLTMCTEKRKNLVKKCLQMDKTWVSQDENTMPWVETYFLMKKKFQAQWSVKKVISETWKDSSLLISLKKVPV